MRYNVAGAKDPAFRGKGGKTSNDITKKEILFVHRPNFVGNRFIYLFFELQFINKFMLN
jgi:hypothetical protein